MMNQTGSSESAPFRMAKPTRMNLAQPGIFNWRWWHETHPAATGSPISTAHRMKFSRQPSTARTTRAGQHRAHGLSTARGTTARRPATRLAGNAGRNGLRRPRAAGETRLAADRRGQKDQDCRQSIQLTHYLLPFQPGTGRSYCWTGPNSQPLSPIFNMKTLHQD